MRKVRLGRTDLMVTKTSLGCLPIQRRDMDTAVKILRRAYEAGINRVRNEGGDFLTYYKSDAWQHKDSQMV